MKIGNLSISDKFYYKNSTYNVITKDCTFIQAKKDNEVDGFTYYFLTDIEVEPFSYDHIQWVNPNHDISDKYTR